MNGYGESGRLSTVQTVAILLAARPRPAWCALADRRSRVALAVADIADAAAGGTGGPESRGLVALARHGNDVAAAVDWLAGDRALPTRVVTSLVDTNAMVVRRPGSGLWRRRRAEADPQVLTQVRAETQSRPRRAVLLALVVAGLAGWLPDARQQAAVSSDPLLPALRAGARRYLRRKSTEDSVAAIGGIVAGSG
jgi:hypothetical protein